MATRVAEMTREELREMVATLIEEKLLELLGDPDEGLALRKSLHDRLLRQKRSVDQGKRGVPFDDVAERLGF